MPSCLMIILKQLEFVRRGYSSLSYTRRVIQKFRQLFMEVIKVFVLGVLETCGVARRLLYTEIS